MRLTGGSMRGRKVRSSGMGKPSMHGSLRATSSRVREAVFNIIGPSIRGAVFVDLYSGTGTMGMEAMSREAERVFFIEADGSRCAELRKMLDGCGCQARAVVRCQSAGSFLGFMRDEQMRADVFFLDPPYASEELDLALPLIGQYGLLAEGGLLLCEHAKQRAMPDCAGDLRVRKTYRYGDTMITLYKRGESA